MSASLPDWPRPQYQPGGGQPFLFFAVYGDVDTSAPLSSSRYRCGGFPEGIDLMGYGPDQHPEVVDSFRNGYLWREFEKEKPDLADEVTAAERCVILRGTPADDTTLNYLRDTVGIVSWMLENDGLAVYDPLRFRWWTPVEWRVEIFDPAGPVPRDHTVVLVSDEEETDRRWFHTRGMRKFGRPDVSVHGVPSEHEAAVVNLCERLIEMQAFGAVVPDFHPVHMTSLPPGGVMRHAGDLDDPEFNNVHLDVSWPEGL
jgi:hypothetical protein